MKKNKIPLKIIVMIVSALFLCVLSFGLFFKVIVNHRFVKAYAEDVYLSENEQLLTFLNAPESYLPYYNLGNVAFENTDYSSAVGYFTKALSLFPLGQKDCDVRINLALSMCYSIDFQHLESKERIDTALVILYKARDILLENGWANDDPQLAKDEDAQQLKEDIDKIIEKLENPEDGDKSQNDQEEDENNDNQDESGSEPQQPSDREKKKQDELDENKKNAMEERRRQQKDMENWEKSEDGEEAGAGSGGSYKPW